MVDHLLGPGGVVGVQTGALCTFPTICTWCFQASTKSAVLLMCEQEGVRQGEGGPAGRQTGWRGGWRSHAVQTKSFLDPT